MGVLNPMRVDISNRQLVMQTSRGLERSGLGRDHGVTSSQRMKPRHSMNSPRNSANPGPHPFPTWPARASDQRHREHGPLLCPHTSPRQQRRPVPFPSPSPCPPFPGESPSHIEGRMRVLFAHGNSRGKLCIESALLGGARSASTTARESATASSEAGFFLGTGLGA